MILSRQQRQLNSALADSQKDVTAKSESSANKSSLKMLLAPAASSRSRTVIISTEIVAIILTALIRPHDQIGAHDESLNRSDAASDRAANLSFLYTDIDEHDNVIPPGKSLFCAAHF